MPLRMYRSQKKSRVVRPSQPGALGGLAAHREYSARWHRQPSPVRERQTRAQLDEPTNDLDLEVLRRLEQVCFSPGWVLTGYSQGV